MSESKDIKRNLARRLEFLEWRVYWTGRVNRADLEVQFQISTPQASLDFQEYLALAPGNIDYSKNEKAYLPTPNFQPKFLKLSPERYLRQLQGICAGDIPKEDTWFDKLPLADVAPTIIRGSQAYVLRSIIRAIEIRGAMNINYQSLSSKGMRNVCPHALAHDGYRWHMRALTIDKGEFRDYVLGRILSISEPTACDANSEDDIEWNTKITLRLTAHPALSADQKAAIEHDYRMENGLLEVTMRIALAYYFIKRHSLDLREGQINPERAQLFLQNFDQFYDEQHSAKERSKKIIADRKSRGELQANK